MPVGEIKVSEDPPPSNQKTTKEYKPSGFLLQWEPGFHGSVSVYNGQGEIKSSANAVPYIVYGLLKHVYGNGLDEIIDDVKYNSFISSLRNAKLHMTAGLDFEKQIWDSSEDDAVHIDLNRGSLQMKDVLRCFKGAGLHPGDYQGNTPSDYPVDGKPIPMIHLSRNEKGLYIAQQSRDYEEGEYRNPNILELEPDEIKGVIDDISEMEDYRGLHRLVETFNGHYCLEPFEEELELPKIALLMIDEIRKGDTDVHLMDISEMFFEREPTSEEVQNYY